MKNTSYFILKALFVLMIYFCLDFFAMEKETACLEDKVNFKIYDVIAWLINNRNKHIAQYLMN